MVQPVLFGVPQAELTSDDHYTPKWVFDTMGLTFDVDVASPPGGIPWIPATRYFTKEDDGLSQPWVGKVWMNPPFSGVTPWMRRFIDHRNGVALIPPAKSQWFVELWNAADGMTTTPRFLFAGGKSIYSSVFFAAFGSECVEAIGRLGTVRSVFKGVLA